MAGQGLHRPGALFAGIRRSFDYPALPYLTLRVATMATIFFDVDFCLSVIKPNHRAFYKRVFHTIELAARALSNITRMSLSYMPPMRRSSRGRCSSGFHSSIRSHMSAS